MAVALNVFRTVAEDVTITPTVVYTSPTGVSAIILMAQVANITNTAGFFTFSHYDGTTETPLVKDFAVGGNDATSATTGKLVLEQGESIIIYANTNNKFKITLSILESANE
jgi:hypothetical protein